MIFPSGIEDPRNIVDKYKNGERYWSDENIREDLDNKRNNFSVLCASVKGDLNIGNIIRSSNAFLAKEVFIYGRKRWDRRSSLGTQNYTHFNHIEEFDLESIKRISKDYHIVGIDNIKNAKPIENYQWPISKHTLICFGSEATGLPQEILDLCHDLVYISQYGSVRSLNVSSAASIVFYDYVQKKQKIGI